MKKNRWLVCIIVFLSLAIVGGIAVFAIQRYSDEMTDEVELEPVSEETDGLSVNYDIDGVSLELAAVEKVGGLTKYKDKDGVLYLLDDDGNFHGSMLPEDELTDRIHDYVGDNEKLGKEKVTQEKAEEIAKAEAEKAFPEAYAGTDYVHSAVDDLSKETGVYFYQTFGEDNLILGYRISVIVLPDGSVYKTVLSKNYERLAAFDEALLEGIDSTVIDNYANEYFTEKYPDILTSIEVRKVMLDFEDGKYVLDIRTDLYTRSYSMNEDCIMVLG